MKKEFREADVDLITLSTQDVIVTSPNSGAGEGTASGDGNDLLGN